MPDFIFSNHGSVCLLAPMSGAAKNWLDEHIGGDALYLGRSLAIEPRYVEDILDGIAAEGMEVA